MSVKFEPIPRDTLPKDLQKYPDLLAREVYSYRVVSRGPARIFHQEYEDHLRAKLGNKKVAFSLHDIILFLAATAGSGVIQNLSYDALKALVSRIRKPKREFTGGKAKFELVVSRRSYNRLRKEKHPDSSPGFSPALKSRGNLS
jgi:hypothetical protein